MFFVEIILAPQPFAVLPLIFQWILFECNEPTKLIRKIRWSGECGQLAWMKFIEINIITYIGVDEWAVVCGFTTTVESREMRAC